MLLVSKCVFAHPGDSHSIAELNSLIAEFPGEQSLYVARGAFHTNSHQWNNAKWDLQQAQELGDGKEVAFELGRLYYHTGDYLKAQASFQVYLSRYPRYAPAYFLLARSARELSQFEFAIESYLKYLEISSRPQPSEYVEAAQAFVTIGNVRQALQVLDKGIKQLGLNPQLQRYAMELEVKRNEPHLALDRWYSLEDQLGKTPRWTMTLGTLLISINRVEEARLALRKAKDQLSKRKSTAAMQVLQRELNRLGKLHD